MSFSYASLFVAVVLCVVFCVDKILLSSSMKFSYLSVSLGNNVNLVHFLLDAGKECLLSSAVVNCNIVHVPGHRIQILSCSACCDLFMIMYAFHVRESVHPEY